MCLGSCTLERSLVCKITCVYQLVFCQGFFTQLIRTRLHLNFRVSLCSSRDQLTGLGFWYTKLDEDDISSDLWFYALEYTRLLAKKDGPAVMSSPKTKKRRSVNLNCGLQTQSANQKYLGRYCQLSHSKPIPSTTRAKEARSSFKEIVMIYHILVLRVCEEKLGLHPFELDNVSTSPFYKKREVQMQGHVDQRLGSIRQSEFTLSMLILQFR